MLILAHKGNSSVAPENTAPAFRVALGVADGIECDVHLSADGVFVLNHDETIDSASTGTGAIADMTLAQLRKYDFGVKWFAEFAGTKICTLEEMLSVCRNMTLLNIEIKQFAAEVDFDPYVRLGKLLNARNICERIIISSFDTIALSYVKAGASKLRTAYLCKPREQEGTIETALSLGCAAVHPRFTDITAEYVAAAHAAGLAVNVWTVDDDADKRRMTSYGVDAIITNKPGIR